VPFARNCGSTSIRGVPHQYAGQPRRVNHAKGRPPTNQWTFRGEHNSRLGERISRDLRMQTAVPSWFAAV
jgi:hypothetical protein